MEETGRADEGEQRVCVCVWKTEAEPVNGELAGLVPLGTSAAVLFHVDLIDGGASGFHGSRADVTAPVSSVISDASHLSVK